MKQKMEKWPIRKLKPHPLQVEVFGDLADAEFDALVADMEAHGLRHPIEIMPDGTIITGHQRVRAAKHLGWHEVEVVVRHDLMQAGDAAVADHFLRDNLLRRHLSPLGKVRAIKKMMENDPENGWVSREDLKASMGKALQLSSRSINRYLLVSESPMAVQNAFDREEVSLTMAGKVAMLKKSDQGEIASRIDDGENPSAVINEYLALPDGEADTASRAYRRFVRALAREVPTITGRIGELTQRRISNSLKTLRPAAELLRSLIRRGSLKGKGARPQGQHHLDSVFEEQT